MENNKWATLILERFLLNKTVLYMDSYHRTDESCQWLKRKKVNHIASITRGRFSTIVDSLHCKLEKSGTFVSAYNKKKKESVVYCWPSNVRLGKKIIIGSKFEVRTKAVDNHICPMFDHYNCGFSGYDKFNRVPHGINGCTSYTVNAV